MAKLLYELCFSILPLIALSKLWGDDGWLQIVTHCPKMSNDTEHVGQIWVVSDFAAVVTIECENGNITKKNHDAVSARFFLGIHPEQQEAEKDICMMKKFPRNDTYQVELIVSKRYNPIMYHPNKQFAVFCTYGPYAKAKTRSLDVVFPNSALSRIINDKGEEKTYTMKMEVVNLDNKPIIGALPLGMKVQLRGRIHDSHGPLQISVDRCLAYNDFRSYEILKDGCGDGLALPSDVGFTSFGEWFYSPIFESFHLRNSTSIQFECTVYFCESPCGPSSCQHSKKPIPESELPPQRVKNTHDKSNERQFDVVTPANESQPSGLTNEDYDDTTYPKFSFDFDDDIGNQYQN